MPADTTHIDSDESTGAWNEFIENHLEDLLESILEGNLEELADRGSDIIVEMDEIVPPTFTYSDESEEGEGDGSGEGPGQGSGGKLSFSLPFHKLMEMLGRKLRLPDLKKEGEGKIKEYIDKWNTIAVTGAILDKKRTFKRALRRSCGMGLYDPEKGQYDFQIHRKDKRFRASTIIEKPKYEAVVLYLADISYSTYGERLELEKKICFIIKSFSIS